MPALLMLRPPRVEGLWNSARSQSEKDDRDGQKAERKPKCLGCDVSHNWQHDKTDQVDSCRSWYRNKEIAFDGAGYVKFAVEPDWQRHTLSAISPESRRTNSAKAQDER